MGMKDSINQKDAITTYEFVYKCECCNTQFYDKFTISLPFQYRHQMPLDEEGVSIWFKDSRTNTKVHVCFDNTGYKQYGMGKLIAVDLYKTESNTGHLNVS